MYDLADRAWLQKMRAGGDDRCWNDERQGASSGPHWGQSLREAAAGACDRRPPGVGTTAAAAGENVPRGGGEPHRCRRTAEARERWPVVPRRRGERVPAAVVARPLLTAHPRGGRKEPV